MLLVATLTLAGLAQGPDPGRRARPLPRTVVEQRREAGEPVVPGLRVELGLLAPGEDIGLPGERPVAATVELDAQGRAELTLEPPPALEPGSVLWARVASPGYQQDVDTEPYDPSRAQLTLTVHARPGGTLHGEVTPPGGAMVERIRLVSVDAPESATQALADEAGRFRVHFETTGRHHLQVSRPGQETAFVRDLALDVRAPPRRMAVELAPGLALAGRLVDPDGHPLYSTMVSALPADLLPREAEIPEKAWSDGHYGQRVVTDPDGRFRLTRLPPGRYLLVGALDGPPRVLSDELLSAGAEDLRVEARLHRLRVRVVDARGMGVGLASTRVHAFSREPGRAILALDPLGRTPQRVPVPFPSEVVRAVEPGDVLRLAYVDPRTTLVERTVSIPARPWLVDEELRLAPPVEPARLRVRWSEQQAVSRIDFKLFTETGIDLGGALLDGPPHELELGPGKYWVRAQGVQGLVCFEGDVEERIPPFTFADVELELAPGGSSSLDLVAVPRARLRIDLAGPARGTAPEIAQALLRREGSGHLQRTLGGARIELHAERGGPPLVCQFAVGLPEWEQLSVPRPWIAPGRECVLLTPLAPGSYRLRAHLHDGRVLERTLELASERATVVELGP